MKRLVLFISLIILGFVIYFLYDSTVEFKKYSNAVLIKEKIDVIDKNIEDFDSNISSKEDEINKIKEEKNEEVRLLEVWKKEAEKFS